jgi:two-component system sensor histidine kinase/response regulator
MKLLLAVGFEVREADDGTKGLELWREWRPDLMFMDMRMPVMDGSEAIRRIRAEEASGDRGHTPILGLTASVLEHEASPLREQGADDVLFKPFREETIFEAIARFVGVRYEYEDDPDRQSSVRTRVFPRVSPASPVAPGRAPTRILMADDDEICRSLATEVLKNAGYDVVGASNGEEALSLLESSPPFAAVLLDVEMPRLGGLETVRRMRNDARFRGLPALAMTAHDDPADIERLLAAGMNDHIPKPFDPDELTRKLAACIARGE